MQNADRHGKPIMIGESTPMKTGIYGREASWDRWFKGYFDFIRTHKMVKAFCYINWDWTAFPKWANWGDCRLEANAVVAEKYRDEIKLDLYFHGGDEEYLRRNLGIPIEAGR